MDARIFVTDTSRIERLAACIKALRYVPRPYDFASKLGPVGSEDVASFLFFMVAIDHDTHLPDVHYEATVDGRLVHGSDLLYLQAASAKRKNPRLFLAASFRDLTLPQVAEIFSTSSGRQPADLAGRRDLLRSCAVTLLNRFEGSTLRLLECCGNRLSGSGGLFERLRDFSAYQDPIAKKPNLLAKILLREGLFVPTDKGSLRASIDHVIMTMALRGGLVRCAERAESKALYSNQALSEGAMLELRHVTSQAISQLSAQSGVPEDRLDDLFWAYGRKALRRPTPLDDVSQVRSELDEDLELSALDPFIAFINGLDRGADSAWRNIEMVKGPFTRYF